MDRRKLLTLFGSTVVASTAGCPALSDSVPAGSVDIRNNTSSGKTLKITVSKMFEERSEIPDDRSEPSSEPISVERYDFQIPAEERVTRRVVSEPGGFYIEFSTETEATVDTWLGLYSAGPEGEQVAEAYIDVRLTQTQIKTTKFTLD